ncbi:MAG: hypothetical protein B6U87_01265 [Candidatus Aenigmarchaeota archaeon ex4484_52]|nr:MAG: hypothetical protein B6U87_01265 [Candidatus Aenigmarchaeota archaeon ex4484_52]
MKIKKLFLAYLILSFLFIKITFANDFDININPNQYSVYPGDIITFNATITNNLNLTKDINIVIKNVKYSTWVTIENSRFSIEPNKTINFEFFISPAKEAIKGTYTFDLDVSYIANNESKTINRKINFYVMELGVLQMDLELKKTNLLQGENSNVAVIVKNIGSIDFKDALLVIGLKEKKIEDKHKIVLLKKEEEKIITKTFEFDEFEKIDNFTIYARLYKTFTSKSPDVLLDEIIKTGTIIKKSKINSSYNEYEDKEKNHTISGNFYAKNNGNKNADVIFSLGILHPIVFYNFSKRPDYFIENKKPEYDDLKTTIGKIYINKGIDKTNNKLTAVWVCNELKPNEICSVSYTIDLKNIYNLKILAFLILFVYAYFIYSHQIYLERKILKISENKTKISIELKNETRKQLDECKVIEFVPASLQLVAKFDTQPPDEIKHTKKGTYLKWIFKPFLIGETRIIIYSVKPLLRAFDGIKIKPTRAIAKRKRKKYIKKTDELNVL